MIFGRMAGAAPLTLIPTWRARGFGGMQASVGFGLGKEA